MTDHSNHITEWMALINGFWKAFFSLIKSHLLKLCEIDGVVVWLPKSPNLWLRFSQQGKKNEMLIASSISYLLSTTGTQLKTIYEMVFFCLRMDFCSFTDETQLTRIFIAKCNWAKWMFAILSQLSNDRFRFGFSHSIYTYWHSKLLEMKCAKIWCDHLWLAILPLVSCIVGNESLL